MGALEKVIVKVRLRFFAEAESRIPYGFTVTGPMSSLLHEATAMYPQTIRNLDPLSLFPLHLEKKGNQNPYFITRLTPNALKSSVSTVYSTVSIPGPLFGS